MSTGALLTEEEWKRLYYGTRRPRMRILTLALPDTRAKVSGVYAIVNAMNGHRYIGSSRDIEGRVHNHETSLRKGQHHSIALQRAWDKYGPEVFRVEILEIVADASQLLTREDSWLPTGQYNIAKKAIAFFSGRHHTEESRALISRQRKGKCKGRVISKEQRAAISKAQKGRLRTPEAREHIRQMRTGTRLTEETKKKIGVASKRLAANPKAKERFKAVKAIRVETSRGVKWSPEKRARHSGAMREANKKRGKRQLSEAEIASRIAVGLKLRGRKLSKEHKANIVKGHQGKPYVMTPARQAALEKGRAASRGKPMSPETRSKIGNALRGRKRAPTPAQLAQLRRLHETMRERRRIAQ